MKLSNNDIEIIKNNIDDILKNNTLNNIKINNDIEYIVGVYKEYYNKKLGDLYEYKSYDYILTDNGFNITLIYNYKNPIEYIEVDFFIRDK